MIGRVEHPERVLNTYYQQPPELNAVELMSCGKTDEGVINTLMKKLPQYGLVPFRVRRSGRMVGEGNGPVIRYVRVSSKEQTDKRYSGLASSLRY